MRQAPSVLEHRNEDWQAIPPAPPHCLEVRPSRFSSSGKCGISEAATLALRRRFRLRYAFACRATANTGSVLVAQDLFLVAQAVPPAIRFRLPSRCKHRICLGSTGSVLGGAGGSACDTLSPAEPLQTQDPSWWHRICLGGAGGSACDPRFFTASEGAVTIAIPKTLRLRIRRRALPPAL
jgi:hypothetical protein